MQKWTGVLTRGASSFLLIALLGGCASHVKGNALPPLKTYSPQFQQKLKAELPTVRACCPSTNTFVQDHVILRDQVRKGREITTRKKGLFKLFR